MELFKFVLMIAFINLLAGCQEPAPSQINQLPTTPNKIHLKVGTLYGPQIYITTGQGKYGFDYELAKRFAEHLALKLEMKAFANISELYGALEAGEIDIIAAGLTETPNRKTRFRLGPPLYEVDQILVYREGTRIPRRIYDIEGPITINADSAYVETLSYYQQQHPELTWQQIYGKDNEELLSMIAEGTLQYTISDSTSLLINRRLMPELRQGMVLANKLPVVWLLPANGSDQLMSQLLSFWHNINVKGTLEHLNERYFGHVKRFDYVDTRAFIRAIDSKLPKYKALFKTYAGDLDWRKLAATSYQESHWNPKARSPTGVRGMMMLTLPTAKQVGIQNRLDAEQSIKGGALYLTKLLNRLPESIPENQRIWFALASYNIGMGHVEDARKIAESMGLNPSAWRDVKQALPLLQQRKYYKNTRYGYARGNEAAHYVDNIRRYYDTMVWLDSQSAHLDEKSQLSQTATTLNSDDPTQQAEASATAPK